MRDLETTNFLRRLEQLSEAAGSELKSQAELLPPPGYAIPMTMHCGIQLGNQLVDRLPRRSSQDHSVIYEATLRALALTPVTEDFQPYFGVGLVPDPLVRYCWDLHHLIITLRNLSAGVLSGDMWSVSTLDGSPQLSITEPMRRSALHLVSEMAEHLAMPTRVRERLTAPTRDMTSLTLDLGFRELDVYVNGPRQAWRDFVNGLPFNLEAVPSFTGFLFALPNAISTWYEHEDLWKLWTAFAEHRGDLQALSESEFTGLLDFFSLEPQDAEQWMVQAPFLKFGKWYALWFFSFHVLHPNLALLSLLIRRYEDLWSRTVGAHLSQAADWIARQLPSRHDLHIATRRSKKGVAEADLCIYDSRSRVMLVAEVKTVFDKFRTADRLRNYTHQKVNFPKAVAQSRQAAQAISARTWSIGDIFQEKNLPLPERVESCVLTWWDLQNPTLGTGDEVLSLNFRTLILLMDESQGDVEEVINTANELARLYCPAAVVDHNVGDLRFRREAQLEVLPPRSETDSRITTRLGTSLIERLAHLPENWSEHEPSLHFYS